MIKDETRERVVKADSLIWMICLSDKQKADDLFSYQENTNIDLATFKRHIIIALNESNDLKVTYDKIIQIIYKVFTVGEISDMGVVPLSQKALRAARIRQDFAKALASVEHGSELSEKLFREFSYKDIRNLACLYKSANKYRRKIIELLDDCNMAIQARDFQKGFLEKYVA